MPTPALPRRSGSKLCAQLSCAPTELDAWFAPVIDPVPLAVALNVSRGDTWYPVAKLRTPERCNGRAARPALPWPPPTLKLDAAPPVKRGVKSVWREAVVMALSVEMKRWTGRLSGEVCPGWVGTPVPLAVDPAVSDWLSSE